MTIAKSLPKDDREENSNSRIKVDAKGQLELDGIDGPLGKAADDFVRADAQYKKATENRNLAMIDLANEMKAAKVRTLKFKGDTMQYRPGHVTMEKIKFIPSTN